MVRTYYEVVVVAELQSRESRSWQESFHYPFVLVHHVIEAIFDLCPPNQDFAKSTVQSELFYLRPNDFILDLHESSLSLNFYIFINYHLKCFYNFNSFLKDVFYLSYSLHLFIVDAKILFYLSIRTNSFSKWLFNREKKESYKGNSNLGI